MKGNKENFLKLVSPDETPSLEKAKERIANRDWLRNSRRIALMIIDALRDQGMTQKDLADQMDVSPQYISKLVKGKENLTLDTMTKLEKLLNINIFASNVEEPVPNIAIWKTVVDEYSLLVKAAISDPRMDMPKRRTEIPELINFMEFTQLYDKPC